MRLDRRDYEQTSILLTSQSRGIQDQATNAPLEVLETALTRRIDRLDALLEACHLITPLFNALEGIVFFIKDAKARYVLANLTLAERCGFKCISRLLGRTCIQAFPQQMGNTYLQQDIKVLSTGEALIDKLELHLFPQHAPGWCLTQKLPVLTSKNEIIGIVGISQDLPTGDTGHPAYAKIALVDDYIRKHFAEPININDLANLADLSISQMERYAKRIYKLTPRQLLHKQRITCASKWLKETNDSITEISLNSGYSDHSAFSRQFKTVTGLTPQQFRQASRKSSSPKD